MLCVLFLLPRRMADLASEPVIVSSFKPTSRLDTISLSLKSKYILHSLGGFPSIVYVPAPAALLNMDDGGCPKHKICRSPCPMQHLSKGWYFGEDAVVWCQLFLLFFVLNPTISLVLFSTSLIFFCQGFSFGIF